MLISVYLMSNCSIVYVSDFVVVGVVYYCLWLAGDRSVFLGFFFYMLSVCLCVVCCLCVLVCVGVCVGVCV